MSEEKKPTYEELEKENRILKDKVRHHHYVLAGYLKRNHIAKIELMSSFQLAYNLEEYTLTPKASHENLKHIISHHLSPSK